MGGTCASDVKWCGTLRHLGPSFVIALQARSKLAIALACSKFIGIMLAKHSSRSEVLLIVSQIGWRRSAGEEILDLAFGPLQTVPSQTDILMAIETPKITPRMLTAGGEAKKLARPGPSGEPCVSESNSEAYLEDHNTQNIRICRSVKRERTDQWLALLRCKPSEACRKLTW